MFTKDVLYRLKNTNNINGILLTKNISQTPPDFYSPEDTCPNRYSGHKKCNNDSPWNPKGSSLLMEDWPFPMFFTEVHTLNLTKFSSLRRAHNFSLTNVSFQNQTLIEAIKSCFWKHNAHDSEQQRHRPLCALEMKSFMFAAINSDSCIKRSDFKLNFNPTLFCDPLGDRNIHWPLGPINKDKNSVILVTARLDASSLFDGISPGAGNVVTGLVTLLATAYYLNILTKDTVVNSESI